MVKLYKKFFLYRAKFIRLGQKSIFDDNASTSKIFSEAIQEKPSILLPRGGLWKIANIQPIGINGGKFAVGRISTANVEKYDEESDAFFEGVDNVGPFSTIYFDITLGVMAIEDKSRVNANTGITAKRIEDLFRASKSVVRRGVFVVIEEISDPESFIDKINKSSSVTRFKSSFRGPNPIDADEIFQKPLEVYAKEINASTGEIVVAGDGLNKSVLIDIARSSAATGNKVSATIIIEEKIKHIKFHKGAKSMDANVDASDSEIFNEMQDTYQEVRSSAVHSD